MLFRSDRRAEARADEKFRRDSAIRLREKKLTAMGRGRTEERREREADDKFVDIPGAGRVLKTSRLGQEFLSRQAGIPLRNPAKPAKPPKPKPDTETEGRVAGILEELRLAESKDELLEIHGKLAKDKSLNDDVRVVKAVQKAIARIRKWEVR